MKMREENKYEPTQEKKLQQKKWFWPAFYAGCSLLIMGLVFTYNVITKPEDTKPVAGLVQQQPGPVIETNTRPETLKYPFAEANLEKVQVLQHFYDVAADAKTRENALLVFKQSYTTSSGISLAMDGQPFEVRVAMSGEVAEVKLDAFTGNAIVVNHANGLQTRYGSVSDITVKIGDKVEQGQPIGKASENEWNPSAGVHLYFEVLENGTPINPTKYLSF